MSTERDFGRPLEITTEIFTKSLGTEVLIYSPLKRTAFLASKSTADFLRELEKGGIKFQELTPEYQEFVLFLEEIGFLNGEPDKEPVKDRTLPPIQLMILPTADCNLRCIYCFSHGGEGKETISFEAAKSAINLISENVKKTDEKIFRLGLHGGGEPTLAWNLLKAITDYAEEKCSRENLELRVNLVSNCIWDEEQVLWVAQNVDQLTISLDGPRELNDMQRIDQNGHGSFEKVYWTVIALREIGYPLRIRTTITEYNVNHMEEMVDFFQELGIRALQFEPLTYTGRAIDSGCKPPQHDIFIANFRRAWEKAYRQGVVLTCSGVRIQRLGEIFCSAAGKMFCLTPDEYVTSCHRVSSKNNPASNIFYYGKYNSETNSFDLDGEKLKKLKNFRMQNSRTCVSCFAKWHCAGGCYEQNLVWNKDPQKPAKYRCKITRELTAHKLQYLIREGNSLSQNEEGS